MKIAFKVKAPIKGIIRNTIFEQFCGGESIDDCEKTIQMLSEYNVRTILDYAVEGDSGEADWITLPGKLSGPSIGLLVTPIFLSVFLNLPASLQKTCLLKFRKGRPSQLMKKQPSMP